MLCCVCVCVCVCPGPVWSVYKSAEDDVSGFHSSNDNLLLAAVRTIAQSSTAVDSTLWPQSVQTLDPDTHLFAGFCDNPSVQLWPSAVILSEGELKCPTFRHIADTISNLRILRQLSHGKHEW